MFVLDVFLIGCSIRGLCKLSACGDPSSLSDGSFCCSFKERAREVLHTQSWVRDGQFVVGEVLEDGVGT